MTFSIELAVRDYECDLQGIVNNANYMHYLEHARHEFLKSHGLDFAEATRQGILLVVRRAELDYLAPLTSGDRFAVSVAMRRGSRLKFLFEQEILRADGKRMLKACFTAVEIDRDGRPQDPQTLVALLQRSGALSET